MTVGNGSRTFVLIAAMVLPGVALVAGGCGSERRSLMDRLPGERHLVGGGIMIDWKAPEPGTVYLVEKQMDKIVETHTLAEGETYTFEVASIVQAEELEELLGIDFSRTQFLLYFEPAVEKGPAQ